MAIITDEPTCEAYLGINDMLAALQSQGWSDQRADLGANATWTPEQRTQVEAVATGIRNAADQLVSLGKQTPHRVMRELYEQYIAYGRAYVDSLPNYTPTDDRLAEVNVAVGNALGAIYVSIDNGAANRALVVTPATPPANVVPEGNPSEPTRFMTAPEPDCASGSNARNRSALPP